MDPDRTTPAESTDPRDAAPTGAPALTETATRTRRVVVDAAARVFAARGFHATTKEKVGEAAEFSHQTVRDYFRTKEALLAAVVSQMWTDFAAALRADGHDRAAVHRVLDAYAVLESTVAVNPAVARCALHVTRGAGPDGGALVTAEEAAARAALAEAVHRGSDGTLSDAAGRERAEVLLAAAAALLCPDGRPAAAAAAGARVTPASVTAAREQRDRARDAFEALARGLIGAGGGR